MKKIKFSLDSLEVYFEKIAKLTKVQRILICVVAFILLIGPFVYFSFIPKHQEIKDLRAKLEDLERQLIVAKQKASELPKVRKQIDEAKIEFNVAKKALPETEEIPALITSISYAGQDAGLEFVLFQPDKERAKGFYAEIPVSINVTGSYHNLVSFFDKVSRLARIVNIKNIRITVAKGKKGEEILQTACTAVTYRFLEKTQ